MPSPSCTVRAGAQRQSSRLRSAWHFAPCSRSGPASCGLIRAQISPARRRRRRRSRAGREGNAHCVIETITGLMSCRSTTSRCGCAAASSPDQQLRPACCRASLEQSPRHTHPPLLLGDEPAQVRRNVQEVPLPLPECLHDVARCPRSKISLELGDRLEPPSDFSNWLPNADSHPPEPRADVAPVGERACSAIRRRCRTVRRSICRSMGCRTNCHRSVRAKRIATAACIQPQQRCETARQSTTSCPHCTSAAASSRLRRLMRPKACPRCWIWLWPMRWTT